MALQFVEGWDGLAASWTAEAARTLATGRFGGNALSLVTTNRLYYKTLTATGTMVAGAALNVSSGNDAELVFGLKGCLIGVNTSGFMTVSNYTTTPPTVTGPSVTTTTTVSVPLNVWNYFEVVVNTSAATAEIFLNGASVWTGSTGATPGGYVFVGSSGASALIDDLYVLDSTGTSFTSRMGSSALASRKPFAVGSSADFDEVVYPTLTSTLTTSSPIISLPVSALPAAIPSGTTVRTSLGISTQDWVTTSAVVAGATAIPVASQTANFAYTTATVVSAFTGGNGVAFLADGLDTTGITSAISGDRSTFTLGAINSEITVYGVISRIRAKSNGTSPVTLRAVATDGTNTSETSLPTLSVTPQNFDVILPKAPDASSWTPASVESTEFGIEVA